MLPLAQFFDLRQQRGRGLAGNRVRQNPDAKADHLFAIRHSVK
jgi:hypothetical protein